MVLVEALKSIGIEGGVPVIVSAVLALMHGRTALKMVIASAIYAKVAGIFAFVFVVLVSGVIPGLSLNVDFSVLTDFLGDIWSLLPVEMVIPW